MKVTLCDGCGASTPTELPAVGWFSLETSRETWSYGAQAGPWHFCSKECIATWAGRDDDTSAQGEGRNPFRRKV